VLEGKTRVFVAEQFTQPERIQAGVHCTTISLAIAKKRADKILRVFNAAGIETYLRHHPLSDIGFADFLDPFYLGFYDLTKREIFVNVKRGENTFGSVFEPGKVKTISSAAQTRDEALARSLLHEVAHCLKFTSLVGTDLESLLRDTFKAGNPISERASRDWKEYFAECFCAHHFHKTAFQAHDPLGYDMILTIRKALKLP
jgi:hypothetical protein